MNEVFLPMRHCKRCGHDWYLSKPQEPTFCPACKSRYWNNEYARTDLVGKQTK
jgi:predicted Zn-ribbon and HTH transcriptional regulator